MIITKMDRLQKITEFLDSIYPEDLNSSMPFHNMVLLSLLIAAASWILSIITKEYSWIDRTWSTAPVVYVSYMAWHENFSNTRLNVMAFLITLWGIRLSYNFARKGGFSYDPTGKRLWRAVITTPKSKCDKPIVSFKHDVLPSEDYRWAVLREKMGPFLFQVFNVTFIAPYQSILILWFCAPVHAAWIHKSTPFGVLDIGVASLFLILWAGETKADEEMWKFQEEKRRKLENAEDMTGTSPFYRAGMYRFSRHPNYFCELGMWWTFYLFTITSNSQHLFLHWTGIGVVMLSLLFDGSVRFGESISASKYPSYANYQAEVNRLIPWMPRKISKND